MSADRPVLGIALMLAFCLLAPLTDGLAKMVGGAVAVVHLVALRFAFQAAIVLPLLFATGGRLAMPRRALALVALRTALQVAGVAAMFLALRHLPLADAIAIAYVMPFIVLLFGWWVLDERVGWRRVAACITGFAGTLMVMQPSLAEVGWPALLPLAVAALFAAFVLITRHISAQVTPLQMQGAGGLIGCLMLLPALPFAQPAAWAPLMGETRDVMLVALLAGVGVIGTLSHLALTAALKHAPAALLAPMQYLEIPAAVALGLLLFGEFPDGLALAGIAVVTGAGLYVIHRERAQARAARRGSRPAPDAARSAAG